MSPSSPPLDQQAFRSDQWIFTSFRLTPNIHSVSLILFNSSELNVKFIRGKKHWEYLVEDGSSKIYIHIFFCLLCLYLGVFKKRHLTFPRAIMHAHAKRLVKGICIEHHQREIGSKEPQKGTDRS